MKHSTFKKLLDIIDKPLVPIVLIGDFNYNCIQPDCDLDVRLHLFGFNNSLGYCVPTTNRNTQIDVVFSKNIDAIQVNTRETYFSDHKVVYFAIKNKVFSDIKKDFFKNNNSTTDNKELVMNSDSAVKTTAEKRDDTKTVREPFKLYSNKTQNMPISFHKNKPLENEPCENDNLCSLFSIREKEKSKRKHENTFAVVKRRMQIRNIDEMSDTIVIEDTEADISKDENEVKRNSRNITIMENCLGDEIIAEFISIVNEIYPNWSMQSTLNYHVFNGIDYYNNQSGKNDVQILYNPGHWLCVYYIVYYIIIII